MGESKNMMSAIIESVRGREILDSRGNPTVEAEVTLTNGMTALSAAPSGASTGSKEAVEKRDGEIRYKGMGVVQAVSSINNEISKSLQGLDVCDQENLDKVLVKLDGSDDKSRLGANAMIAVSLATQKAAAKAQNIPLYQCIGGKEATTLPIPLMNIINGGAHAKNALDIQEFMIVPHQFNCFSEALCAGVEIFHTLRHILIAAGLSTAVGDEGGFAPDLKNSTVALDYIMQAIEKAGYQPGTEVGIALDCAASEFYHTEQYHLPGDNFVGTAKDLCQLFEGWLHHYPIISIEDGCDESDYSGWQQLTQHFKNRLQLVGDDLFVTNTKLLTKGIEEGMGNALLVKPNQIGTLTETIQAIEMAKKNNYQTIMSHRSGETEFSDIADIAVGTHCSQIKIGAPCRSERTSKYNRLLRIADKLSQKATYAGLHPIFMNHA